MRQGELFPDDINQTPPPGAFAEPAVEPGKPKADEPEAEDCYRCGRLAYFAWSGVCMWCDAQENN